MKVIIIEGPQADKCMNDCYHYLIKLYRQEIQGDSITEEQAIKGSSIDSQFEACIKKAGTKDVLKYADEGFSGELLERPALNA
ncbi:hypothetical protein ACVK1V_002357 [Bacillus subtilis]